MSPACASRFSGALRMVAGRRMVTRGVLLACVLVLACCASARATFPGVNWRIAYTSVRSGQTDVFSSRLDGSGELNASGDSRQNATPVWSPDARRIAFITTGCEGDCNRVEVADANGDNRYAVASGYVSDPAWSPDGTRLSWVDNSGASPRIVIATVSGEVQRVAPIPIEVVRRPTWSPDARWIAFLGATVVCESVACRYDEAVYRLSVLAPPEVAPTAALAVSPASGGSPLAVTADASASTDADDTPIASYAFDWGDGSTTVAQSAPQAAHTYSNTGTYTVTVTVTDTGGRSSTAASTVTVNNAPHAALSLSYPSVLVGWPVIADASASTDADDTPIATYAFDWGDGNTTGAQSAPRASHAYANTGTFTVTVTVTDTGGLASQASATVQVYTITGPSRGLARDASRADSDLSGLEQLSTAVRARTISDDGVSWAPDGGTIVFSAGGRLFRIPTTPPPLGGHVPAEIPVSPSPAADPAWSPDGSKLAYVAGTETTSSIWIVAANGGAASQFPAGSTSYDSAPDWQPARRPVATVTGGPSDSTEETTARFTFSGESFAVTSGSPTFACAVDQRDWAPRPCSAAGEDVITGLTPGTYTFRLVPVDADGLTGAAVTRSWRVDEPAPPDTTITAGPPVRTLAHTATFEFISNRGVGFACRLDRGAWRACSGSGTDVISGLVPGAHTFAVRAVDARGRVDPTPATRDWTVLKRPAPRTRILTGPKRRTDSRSATFTFDADENGSTFECALDSRGWRPCSSTSRVVITGLAVGKHRFSVRATNDDGIRDPDPPDRRWTVLPRRLPAQTTPWALWHHPDNQPGVEILMWLKVLRAPAGVKVGVVCRGRGCPQRAAGWWHVRRAGTVPWPAVGREGLALGPGASVDVRVKKSGFIGVGKLYCVFFGGGRARVDWIAYRLDGRTPTCARFGRSR